MERVEWLRARRGSEEARRRWEINEVLVDWTEAPDPTMRHNGAPTMVLHMKEGREWREREAKGRRKGRERGNTCT